MNGLRGNAGTTNSRLQRAQVGAPRPPLTVVGHWGPLVELPFVGHGVEVAALELAEGGSVRGAAPHVADPEPFPLPQAVPAPVLGSVGGKQGSHRGWDLRITEM